MSLTVLIATPASPLQWQQFWFCRTDGSLTNQTLTIKNMEQHKLEDCTFKFTAVPFLYNCSRSECIVLGNNETCIEMLTPDLSTKYWRMECGDAYHGDGLTADAGETLNDLSMEKKISEYLPNTKDTEPPDRSAKSQPYEDSTPMWIGLGAAVLGVFLLGVLIWFLYTRSDPIRSWVDSRLSRLGLCNINNAPGTDPAANGYSPGHLENGLDNIRMGEVSNQNGRSQ